MHKIIKKLQKLIAHQKSAKAIGNPAEAAAFAERIQQMLSKYNLSMSQVELHAAKDSKVDAEPVQERFSTIETWQTALLYNLCRLNGCHALEHDLFQIVVGRSQDRQIVISLFRYFEKLGLELAANYMNDRQKVYSAVYPSMSIRFAFTSDKSRRDSFLLGFVASVCQRFEETSKKNVEASDNSTALVFLSNRQKDNKDWVDANLNVQTEELEIDKNIDHSAFMRGASVGESVALTDKSLK